MRTFWAFMKTCWWDKYRCCQGRASRKEFWGFLLCDFFLTSVVVFCGYFVGGKYFACLMAVGWGILSLPPLWSVQVRRLHDVGFSGRWCWSHLLPGIGNLGILWLLLRRGTKGENRFDAEEPVRYSRILPAVAILMGIAWFWQVPCPVVRVTEATHFITQPRKADGRVDYYAAFMEKYRDAYAQPEKNGFRKICEALGKRAYSSLSYETSSEFEDWPKVCEVLQLDPDLTPRFADWEMWNEEYLQKRLPTRKISREDGLEEEIPDISSLKFDKKAFYCQYSEWIQEEDDTNEEYLFDVLTFYTDQFYFQPWRSEDSPLAAEWLKENEAFLDTVVEAVQQPYYTPHWAPDGSALLCLDIDILSNSRTFARLLSMRILHSIGEKAPEKAIQDILAIYRLGIHFEKGPGWIGGLVGMALEGLGNEMVQKFLLFGNPTLEQLQFLEKELFSLPPRPKFAHMMETENLTIFDSIQDLFRDGGYTFYFLEYMTCMEYFQWYCHTADQNIARRTFCEIWMPMYQKMTTLTNALERQRFHQEWEASLSTICQGNLYGLDVLSVRGRSELVGKGMIRLLMPSLGGIHSVILRSETRFRLAQIAVVLEQFRRQKGRYPENQEEATPMLAEHGLDWYDPYSEKQTLVYRLNPQSQEAWQHEYDQKCERILKEEAQEEDFFLDSFSYWKPYLLYSFGSNQKDDGGIPLNSDGERADEVF